MRKIVVSNMVTLDGFIAGTHGEIDWHMVDDDFMTLAHNLPNEFDTHVYGRVTYELMAGYWPTPAGVADDPATAEYMNATPKVVFSRTLDTVEWQNARLAQGNIAEEITSLKQQPGKDIVIFGSGTIVSQLTRLGLIDEYRLFVCPVVLGSGIGQFRDVIERVNLKLAKTQTFQSGVVFLLYQKGA